MLSVGTTVKGDEKKAAEEIKKLVDKLGPDLRKLQIDAKGGPYAIVFLLDKDSVGFMLEGNRLDRFFRQLKSVVDAPTLKSRLEPHKKRPDVWVFMISFPAKL